MVWGEKYELNSCTGRPLERTWYLRPIQRSGVRVLHAGMSGKEGLWRPEWGFKDSPPPQVHCTALGVLSTKDIRSDMHFSFFLN